MRRKNIVYRKPDGSVHLEFLTLDPDKLLADAGTVAGLMNEAVDASTEIEIKRRLDAVDTHQQRLENMKAAVATNDQALNGEVAKLRQLQDAPAPAGNAKQQKIHQRTVAAAIKNARREKANLDAAKAQLAQVETDLAEAQAAATADKIAELRAGAKQHAVDRMKDMDALRDKLESDAHSREHAALLRKRAAEQHEANVAEAKAAGRPAPEPPYYLTIEPVAYDVQELPGGDDLYFLDAMRWDHDGGKIHIPLDQAREVHRRALRAERKAKLDALDAEYRKAQGAGDTDAMTDIDKRAQALRDVTKHPAYLKASDLDAIRAATVDSLLATPAKT